MSIDWKALKSQKKLVEPFFGLILGPSGAGKSTLIGTLQKPTLYLYTSLENHGPIAAGAVNKNIIPYCIDRSDKGELLSADQAYERTLEVLSDKSIIDNVKAIAVDGASELDFMIRKTKSFEKYITNEKGIRNNFKEGESVLFHLKTIIDSMKTLHSQGLDCFMTCAALVKNSGEDGSVSEVEPRLTGFGVGTELPRQFGDVLLVSRVNIATESNPEPHSEHVMIFHATVTKMSKDMRGQVMKTANFSPRVAGLLVEELPPIMKADLKLLEAVKKK